MDLDLTGQRAVVCGSTQGIGKASAMELAALGATVTLLSRDEDKLKEVVAELPHPKGQRHDYVVADFNRPEDIRAAATRALKSIDILVNNSGGPAAGNILDATMPDFMQAINSHLFCSQLLVQIVAPSMKEKRYGRIVNIISTSVKIPIRGLGVSNTVRGAMASWAKTLSLELGPFGITVNNVLPGSTKTGRIESVMRTRSEKSGKTMDEIRASVIAEIPAGRMAEVGEIAAAVAFLASPAASYINGVSLPVDGGRTGSL